MIAPEILQENILSMLGTKEIEPQTTFQPKFQNDYPVYLFRKKLNLTKLFLNSRHQWTSLEGYPSHRPRQIGQKEE